MAEHKTSMEAKEGLEEEHKKTVEEKEGLLKEKERGEEEVEERKIKKFI